MSKNLESTLIHIRDNVVKYNVAYNRKVLNFTDEYIEKYREEIETDCWGTSRMILNVLNQGHIPIRAILYHIDNPFFSGYHDFIIISKDYKDPWYLCDAWCGRYPTRIVTIKKKELDDFLYSLRELDIPDRQELFSQLFAEIEVNPDVKPQDIRISWIDFTLYYSMTSVINYANLESINKTNINNFEAI